MITRLINHNYASNNTGKGITETISKYLKKNFLHKPPLIAKTLHANTDCQQKMFRKTIFLAKLQTLNQCNVIYCALVGQIKNKSI